MQTDGIAEANGTWIVFTPETDEIEEFQKRLALNEANEKRGRHWDIRQGDFGPQDDDDESLFPFVEHYRTNWQSFLIPLDPFTGDPFDEERTNKFFAWRENPKK